jgi:O-antigen ligase
MTASQSRWIPWALALLVALIPFARLSEAGLLLLVGLALWWRPKVELRALWIAFSCVMVPLLLALPDALALRDSVESTLGYLRFGALAAALLLLLDHARLQRAETIIAAVLAAWTLDALIQALTGQNLLGYSISQDRINGVFGDGNLKLGATLAVLGPIALEVSARRSLRAWALCALLLSVVILLAGTRAAWLMWACVLALYAWWLLPGTRRQRLLRCLAIGAVGVVVVSISYGLSPRFAERIDRTAMAFQGDRAALDEALAYRLPIWDTALNVTEAHPINGIGARGFRHAYPSYAAAGDRFVDAANVEGAAHPHQLLLEFAAETGVIGITGLFALIFWLTRMWLQAPPDARLRARPYGAALVAMLFPLNTHYAWFSSFWGMLVWLIIGLYFVALNNKPTPR